MSQALRLIEGEVWERGYDGGQEGRRAGQIKSEHVRMDAESAGSKKDLGMLFQKEATGGHICTWREGTEGGCPGDGGKVGGAAHKDVAQPICMLGSKSLNEGVKPGLGTWKTDSGELSEEQGRWEGKRVTKESLAWVVAERQRKKKGAH